MYCPPSLPSYSIFLDFDSSSTIGQAPKKSIYTCYHKRSGAIDTGILYFPVQILYIDRVTM